MATPAEARPEAAARPSPVARVRVRLSRRLRGPAARWIGPGFVLVVVATVAVGLYLASASNPGSAAPEPLATFKTAELHALAFLPSSPRVIFFGHHNGLMRSDDEGTTWQAVLERADLDVMAVAGGFDGQSLYLAGHGVFESSTDGGRSWQTVPLTLPDGDIHGFAASPSDPNRLYAFVAGSGLFRSSDGGRSWERSPAQLPDDVLAIAASRVPRALYAATLNSGVLLSADEGRTWTAVGTATSAPVLALAVDPSSPKTVYLGAKDGLYQSTDGGTQWTKLSFPGGNAAAIAIDPRQSSTVLAIATGNGEGLLYRSTDGGQSWGRNSRAGGH